MARHTRISDGKWETTYTSNSMCGAVVVEDRIGLYLEQYGTLINRGRLELWAYNLSDGQVTVDVTRLQPFRLETLPRQALALEPADVRQLVGGTPRTAAISLRPKEYPAHYSSSLFEMLEPAYWEAAVGDCAAPTSIVTVGSHATRDAILQVLDETVAASHGSRVGTKIWNQNDIAGSDVSEARDSIGGPSRTRTLDPLIKSHLERRPVYSALVRLPT
ncbi:MAG: hypothetical protein HYV93_15620 [Candidatus Rokubacteria bacterium]|nr:hypothetical protein [Candidatus Rokubacteria bacterium]